jgi:hypothetical protein
MSSEARSWPLRLKDVIAAIKATRAVRRDELRRVPQRPAHDEILVSESMARPNRALFAG